MAKEEEKSLFVPENNGRSKQLLQPRIETLSWEKRNTRRAAHARARPSFRVTLATLSRTVVQSRDAQKGLSEALRIAAE